MALTLTNSASKEIVKGAAWYEERKEGLGNDFLREVNLAIARVVEAPERWPVIRYNARRCLLHRFPYSIIYRIKSTGIRIVAVPHGKQRADYWRHRR